MKTFLRITVMMILIAVLCTPPGAAAVAAKQAAGTSAGSASSSAGVPPDKYLNLDGTIRLDVAQPGMFNLEGWDVTLDPQRGPVFGAQPSAPAVPPPPPVGDWWALGGGGAPINEEVRAALIWKGDLYIGGDFTNAGGVPEADFIAMWDGSGWKNVSDNGWGNGSVSGTVTALAGDANYLYVGGMFYSVKDKSENLPAARFMARWDGSKWSAMGHGATASDPCLWNGHVDAIAIDPGGNVVVGGSFTDVHNGTDTVAAADYLAAWDGSDWSALSDDGEGDGSLHNAVYALAFDSGGMLYVGGQFVDVVDNGTPLIEADYIAAYYEGKWQGLSKNGSTGHGSLSSSVRALAASGKNVYVGGYFSGIVDGAVIIPEARYIALWDGSKWEHLGSNGYGNGALDNSVLAIALGSTAVYVGGLFENVSDDGTPLPAADYVAKWDGGRWHALAGTAGAADGALFDGRVEALLVQNPGATEVLYAGGDFAGARDPTGYHPAAANLALWDGSSWWEVGSPEGSLTNNVYAVAVSGTDVYVGGSFMNVADGLTAMPEADYIARWDGVHWNALGSDGMGGGALHEPVRAIAVDGDDVYVGGDFCGVYNGSTFLMTACGIAKWNGATGWSALGYGGTTDSPAITGDITAIAASGGIVYAGGNFTDVNNQGDLLEEADYIARWDGSNWSALGGGGAGGGALNSWVYAIAISGTDVYAGGAFIDAYDGGVMPAADHIARWDGSHWNAMGSRYGGEGSVDGEVYAIVVDGTNVYAAGDFADVKNDQTFVDRTDYIAKWDGAYWSALGGNEWGHGSLNSPVYCLLLHNGMLYAGGTFVDLDNGGVQDTTADYVARWNGLEWSGLGDDGSGEGSISGGNMHVYALAVSGSELYVGGNFTDVNNHGTLLDYADYFAAHRLASSSAIDVAVGGAPQGSYVLPPSGSHRQSYTDLNDGPVEILENGGNPIIAALRVNLKNSPTYASYGEFMGLPISQLSDQYIFPWYNNANTSGLDSQLRFGNVGGSMTTVYVNIGGVDRGNYNLDPNESLRVSYPDLNSGPVRVQSTGSVPIIASMRINLKTHPTMSSYTEFTGIPSRVRATGYMFPWYNNGAASGLDSQLRFGNVGYEPTVVTVMIAGKVRGTYGLAANASLRVSYPDLNNGSVYVSSSGATPIIASMRVNLKKHPAYLSYAEFMGLSTPPEKSYIFPWYNNGASSGLDTQLRFGNVGTGETHVTVTIAGTPHGPYTLQANDSLRVSYTDLNDGPVVISSDNEPIIASIRINLKKSPTYSSYAEFLGMSIGYPVDLPKNQMSERYVFPWYNNGLTSGLDSQLRFGLP